MNESMMEMPLVTVVTVCFNLFENNRVENFEQCCDSVQFQDYPRLEHLVVDGGSTDGTTELLEVRATAGRLRYISEPDAGIYDAMNKGIRLARGKYIVFLNFVAFWHHRAAVSESVAALERSGAAFSYASCTIVNEEGSFVCTEAAGLGVFPNLMPFCLQTMFTRSDILLQYKEFDDKHYRCAADYDLVFRLLLGGEHGVYVPLNFTSFRLGGFSVAGDDLSQHECRMVRQRLLGKRAARVLNHGYLDDDLMLRLTQHVHPSVALDLLRCYVQASPGRYHLAYGLVRQDKDGVPAGALGACGCVEETWCLFNLLPLVVCKVRPPRRDYLLAGFLPLLRICRKPARTSWRLFFIIPLLSISNKEQA